MNKEDCKLVVAFAFWIGAMFGLLIAFLLWKLVEVGVL